MKERIKIGELTELVGKEVLIAGWVSVRRDQGKMVFFDIRDISGTIQAIVLPSEKEAIEVAKKIRPEFVISAKGIINKRPEGNINKNILGGDVELQIKELNIISESEFPFELNSEVNLDTHLDHLPYTLRTEKSKDIFKVQETIVRGYASSLKEQAFTEFQAPALVGGDAEGGSAVFEVGYYYDQKVYLATSPQFYKQIMVGAFERVFTIAKVFRAEKSATTRHISEITQMDFEMGFIDNELDVMKVLEQIMKDVCKDVIEKHSDILNKMGVAIPLAPEKFPILTLREAQKILGVEEAPDLEPEQERALWDWAKKEHNSDFVFITRFPTQKRAFYTYEEPNEAPFSRGFDLLFKGLEINSGAQRIHNYNDLVERIKERGMNPEKFSFYLEAFKVGMPPHGGSSTGLERFTARMLDLPNVKEATLFPRDMNRVDRLLSSNE